MFSEGFLTLLLLRIFLGKSCWSDQEFCLFTDVYLKPCQDLPRDFLANEDYIYNIIQDPTGLQAK